jgi:hypothetical protein
MKTINKKLTVNVNKVVVVVVAITICFTIVPGFKTEARAGKGAAFLGGMVAGHVVGGMVRRSRIRTAAAVQEANQPKTQTVYVQQPATTSSAQTAPAAKPTAQQRLDQLDKLAAGGYITPQEYKAKKKAILDSM